VIVVSESELAVLAMDAGRWAEAAGRVEAALAVIDKARMQGCATSAPAFAAAARLALHRGDMKGANRELTRAMRARPSLTFVFPYLAVLAVVITAASVQDRDAARPCCGTCPAAAPASGWPGLMRDTPASSPPGPPAEDPAEDRP